MEAARSWEPAAVAETHCAVVFFAGDRAYKVKKPLDLGFLDFRTAAARREACVREVRLNRRLTPDVYLGVADVLDPDGEVCDSLVVMRRMPAEARLSTVVRSGADVSRPLRALARQLAAFHATARHDATTSAEGTRDAVRARWRDSFEQTRGDRGTVLDRERTAAVERLALRYLAGREPLFDARIAAGLVRDGHGDLLADDVFVLPDGPCALDCLEFDDRLRYVDGVDDAAFLAMDLERLGAPGAAESFLDWYAEFAGAPPVPSLDHRSGRQPDGAGPVARRSRRRHHPLPTGPADAAPPLPSTSSAHHVLLTNGTAPLNAGVSLQALMQLLGHVSAAMSLRYGQLFDTTVRGEYERALTQAKAQLLAQPATGPATGTALPLVQITGGRDWRDTPTIKARLSGGFCLRAPAQGSCPYANICEHCPNFRTDAGFLAVLGAQHADALALAADAATRGWSTEADRHRRLADRLDQLITQTSLDKP